MNFILALLLMPALVQAEIRYPLRELYQVQPLDKTGKGTPYSHSVSEKLTKVYLDELAMENRLVRGKGSETEQRQVVSKALMSRNQVLLEQLRTYIPQRAHSARHEISKEQAVVLLAKLKDHAVVGEKALARFDPKGQVGFCFGRALYVHIELLHLGVDPAAIIKIFALGSLRYFGALWEFHMVTAVKGPGSTWWVIDALLDEVLTVDQWASKAEAFDSRPQIPLVRLYTTDARKFQPDYAEYDSENLSFPHFNGYFHQLLKSFGIVL